MENNKKVIGKASDKSTMISSLRIDKLVITNQKEIANELGRYFSTVGETYANKIEKSVKNIDEYLALIPRNKLSIFISATTASEIGKLIDKLPNKKSSGYDNIDNILLKSMKEQIIQPLMWIFNKSISDGIFLECMKTAEVVPLYKSKSRQEKSNYRPISLLLTISKLLEKLIYKQVYWFLSNTQQLYTSQYGFRSGHSCNQAVNELIAEIAKNTERNWTTVCVFLDLSKAFDMLEHTSVYKN